MALAIVDANLLLYAFNPDDPSHAAATEWLEEIINSRQVIALPMLAIAALVRVSTNPRLDRLPERMQDVLAFVERLLALPNVRVLHTDAAHWTELRRVLDESGVHGPTVTDAQYAALARQHNGTLYSTDKHFRRFPRLRCVNPLEGALSLLGRLTRVATREVPRRTCRRTGSSLRVGRFRLRPAWFRCPCM